MEEQIASVAISAADVYLISSKSKDIKLAYAQFKVNQTALSNHVLLNDFRSKEFGAFLSDRKDSTALMLCLFASEAQDLKLPSLIRLTAGLLTLECLLTAATITDLSDGAQVGKSLTLKDSASSGVGLAMAAAISNGNTAEFCPNIIGIPLLGSDKSGEIHRRSCKPCLAADAPTIIRHENPVFNDTELKLANRKSNRSNHIESDIQAAKLSPPLTSLSVISPPVTADAIFDGAYLMLLTAAESHVPRLELDMFDQVMGILRKLNWSGVFSPNSNVYVQTKIKKASKYAFATFGPRSFDQFVEGKDYFVGMRDVLKYVHRQLEARHVDVKSLIESAKAFNSQIGL